MKNHIQMDREARLAREIRDMQDRVNDARLQELQDLQRRMANDGVGDDYYSDEKMRERFRQEPPDEVVCGVSLPKTNGVRWWTPKSCPRWIEGLFNVVQWFQTVSIFLYPIFLYRSFGLLPLLLRVWLIVPLGQHLEWCFMDSGHNKGTAYGTIQVLYVASYLFAATVDWDDWPVRRTASLLHLHAVAQTFRLGVVDSLVFTQVLGYGLLFMVYLWGVGFATCLLEASIGRSLWAACTVYTQLLCWCVRSVRDEGVAWAPALATTVAARARGAWADVSTSWHACSALVVLATFVVMSRAARAVDARAKVVTNATRSEREQELRRRLAALLGTFPEDVKESLLSIAGSDDAAARLKERLRMRGEDRGQISLEDVGPLEGLEHRRQAVEDVVGSLTRADGMEDRDPGGAKDQTELRRLREALTESAERCRKAKEELATARAAAAARLRDLEGVRPPQQEHHENAREAFLTARAEQRAR